MPAPSVKPESPPAELLDRSEGWGTIGTIFGYPENTDDGEWPFAIVHNSEFDDWPSETSHGQWSHEVDI
jgi:hypothetical protein